NIPIALSLARAHLLNNEPQLAERYYKNILKQNPEVLQARFALADIYRRSGKINLATGQLEKVLEKDPDNIKALSALGDMALEKEP
ncbi:MAG: tetratricopeptide repeat protein, partial [Desulfobacterales bacterium]|nr:tetratricopeptide repeat protein [Desulfobacterales bacterium]